MLPASAMACTRARARDTGDEGERERNKGEGVHGRNVDKTCWPMRKLGVTSQAWHWPIRSDR